MNIEGNCVMLGIRVRAARKEKNLTQKELGRLMQMDAKYVSKVENGKVMPNIRRLVQLSRVLDKSCDYFIWDMVFDDETGGEEIWLG